MTQVQNNAHHKGVVSGGDNCIVSTVDLRHYGAEPTDARLQSDHLQAELVILLDDSGTAIGTAEKASVHTEDTALHLAFSCHLSNARGEVLLTRRAIGKKTWPGVWTNSFCGHPAPGETIEDAIIRRAEFELGILGGTDRLLDITSAIPDFRYRAVDASGIVENEFCPVFTAVLDGPLFPNPDEVMDHAWVSPAALATAVAVTPWAFSPWLVLQCQSMKLYPAQNLAPSQAPAQNRKGADGQH